MTRVQRIVLGCSFVQNNKESLSYFYPCYVCQVKLKILDAVYKNTPFSLRPAVDEVDLEWRCGQYQGGHIILQDLDITSKIETSGWRKINTLSHYGVKDKVVVSLVPKQVDSPSHHIYQVNKKIHFIRKAPAIFSLVNNFPLNAQL